MARRRRWRWTGLALLALALGARPAAASGEHALREARQAAQAYFNAMLVWESERAGPPALRRAALAAIFRRHLSREALRRSQSRLDLLDVGTPPEFSEPIQSVEPAGAGRAWVYVADGVIGGRARYLLKTQDGRWTIDARQRDSANLAQWKEDADL